MSVRSLSLSLLLAAAAAPAVGQAPDSVPAPRHRSSLRFNYRMGDVPFRFNRLPNMDLERTRMRALDQALRVRREMNSRGFEMALRAETRSRAMLDRNWQRRREVEERAMERVRDQVNRLKFRQPLRYRRHFRDI